MKNKDLATVVALMLLYAGIWLWCKLTDQPMTYSEEE